MKFKLLILIFISCKIIISQNPTWQWAKSGGGTNSDNGSSVATDASGNVFVSGFYFSPSIIFGTYTLTNSGNYDLFVVKYDPSGNVIWAKTAGGAFDDMATCIATNSLGEVYVTGNFTSSTIIFGTYTLTNTGGSDIFIVKYDALGNVMWALKEGANNNEESNGIALDNTGNIFITGQFQSSLLTVGIYTLSNVGIGNVLFVKYNSSGIALWALTVGGSNLDVGNALATDAAGNIFITGYFKSNSINSGTTTLSNNGNSDVFILKYDGAGNPQWAKSAGVLFEDVGTSIAIDPGGNVLLTGYYKSSVIGFGIYTFTNTAANTCDLFVVKYSNSGNELWAKSLGGTVDDIGFGIACDVAGNVFVTGHIHSPNMVVGTYTLTNAGVGVGDVFVLKYNGLGTPLWAECEGGSPDDGGNGIATDATGNVFVCGFFVSPNINFGSYTLTNVNSSDIFVAKLSSTTGIENLQSINEQLLIYPNPGNGIFKIKSETSINYLEVFNCVGERVFSMQDNNSPIDISDKPRGIYFVRIYSGEKHYTLKFILT